MSFGNCGRDRKTKFETYFILCMYRGGRDVADLGLGDQHTKKRKAVE